MPSEAVPEQCRHCYDYEPIALHCSDCGHAVCVKCVLGIEERTGLCWKCEALQRAKVKDAMVGRLFGSLLVLRYVRTSKRGGHKIYECVCECGNIQQVYGYALRNGNTQRCLECSKQRRDESHDRICASAFKRPARRI
jgi:hypothetical protein